MRWSEGDFKSIQVQRTNKKVENHGDERRTTDASFEDGELIKAVPGKRIAGIRKTERTEEGEEKKWEDEDDACSVRYRLPK